MPLNLPDYTPLKDSDFPPHGPPAATINEEQAYLGGSAVKRSDQVIIVTPEIGRAHEWMAQQGYTKRHAIVLVTSLDQFELSDDRRFKGSQIRLFHGCEQGEYYAAIIARLLVVVDDGTEPQDWQWV